MSDGNHFSFGQVFLHKHNDSASLFDFRRRTNFQARVYFCAVLGLGSRSMGNSRNIRVGTDRNEFKVSTTKGGNIVAKSDGVHRLRWNCKNAVAFAPSMCAHSSCDLMQTAHIAVVTRHLHHHCHRRHYRYRYGEKSIRTKEIPYFFILWTEKCRTDFAGSSWAKREKEIKLKFNTTRTKDQRSRIKQVKRFQRY